MPIRKADTTMARFHALQLEEDDKDALRIAAKRAAAEARDVRIHDPRARSMGLDTIALDAQRTEKSLMLADEARRTASEEAHRVADLAAVQAAAVANAHAAQAAREQYGRDLADQIATTATGTASSSHPDSPVAGASALGPSSIQVFDGEDVHKKERETRQAAEVRAWATSQLSDQAIAAKSIKAKDLELDHLHNAAAADAGAAAIARVSARKAEARAIAATNAAAAEAAAQRKTASLASSRTGSSGGNSEGGLTTDPRGGAGAVAHGSSFSLSGTAAGGATMGPAAPPAGMRSGATRSDLRHGGAASMSGLLAEDPLDGVSAADPRRIRVDHYRGPIPIHGYTNGSGAAIGGSSAASHAPSSAAAAAAASDGSEGAAIAAGSRPASAYSMSDIFSGDGGDSSTAISGSHFPPSASGISSSSDAPQSRVAAKRAQLALEALGRSDLEAAEKHARQAELTKAANQRAYAAALDEQIASNAAAKTAAAEAGVREAAAVRPGDFFGKFGRGSR